MSDSMAVDPTSEPIAPRHDPGHPGMRINAQSEQDRIDTAELASELRRAALTATSSLSEVEICSIVDAVNAGGWAHPSHGAGDEADRSAEL
jgi:hypothetical protein